ncbi:hypothetical protein F443_08995 [Phytophthora nicotianae P1569]|uniref:Uncharacterized protein n=1 Tax=Phytophthora nicotianae P1569 TaxID=1317065 RepID=V9F511_PHYNI|nr:hypothetical protein F443_08995 [Phytophthora nicotianae P1569]
MMPGEMFADFAAGLRDAAGQSRVREKTLLGQLYRGLDKTTRQLVKLEPAPTTLGEAIDKPMKIDDSSYNVALGMINNGKARVMNLSVQIDGTKGAMQAIPCISCIPADAEDDEDMEGKSRVFFTNPQDNDANVWVAPGGRTWNARYWRLNKKSRSRERRTASQAQRELNKRYVRPDKKVRVLMVMADEDASSNEESEVPSSPPRKKNRNARVRQTKAPDKTPGSRHPTRNGPAASAQVRKTRVLRVGNLVTLRGTTPTPQ